MNKKLHVTIWSTIIIFLVSLNIYVYNNSLKVSKYVDESNSHTESIVLIDKFRTDINVMAQVNKLYLLTGKNEYKIEYDETLKRVYKTINDLEASGSISNDDKSDLIKALEEYSHINMETMSSNIINKIDANVENEILKSNEAQLSVFKELDKSVEQTNKTVREKNNVIESILKNQKGNVQFASTIITAIASGIFYYIKKNPAKVGKQVGEIIDCITNIEGEKNFDLNKTEENQENINLKNSTKDELYEEIKEIEKKYDDVKECINNIIKYEKVISYCDLMYSQTIKMEEKIDKSNEIMNEIYIYLNQLKINLRECKDCKDEIKLDLIREIQEKFVELKIVFESIPIYNDVIKEAMQEVINYKI